MFNKVGDFLYDWNNESAATLKLFAQLTDDSLLQKVTPEGRSLGRLAWHITQSISEMMHRTGLEFSGTPEDAPVPASADEIYNTYLRDSEALRNSVSANWTDDMLSEEDDMYGERWKKGLTLQILIRHQIHHRGQLTVLMRQAGLKVPGIYGPAREEWAEFGMASAE